MGQMRRKQGEAPAAVRLRGAASKAPSSCPGQSRAKIAFAASAALSQHGCRFLNSLRTPDRLLPMRPVRAPRVAQEDTTAFRDQIDIL
mmetsp:Transcript_55203/g.99400  ORF Transcript_55203/g.99400 Transcript_55203/m.99400 type:complete len:88 (-) Transcript_55203:304-567(-)